MIKIRIERTGNDVHFHDGANTLKVKIDLHRAYGNGMLTLGGVGVVEDTLSAGSYDYMKADKGIAPKQLCIVLFIGLLLKNVR